MNIIAIILTILGLSLFEIISSIDNAIINAEVLSRMSTRAKKWFLTYGLLFAVFILRGVLPWLIVWVVNPQLGFFGSFMGVFSSDPYTHLAIEKSSSILLTGGGVFLIFLFFHWLFLEPKHYGIRGEFFFFKQGVWFYAVISILLASIVWWALQINQFMAMSAVVGSTIFFITHGFKENAKRSEEELLNQSSNMSDISKIFYLEIIDATFSIDGVLGAFAFTLVVPLILIGNGFGALVLRQLTIKNIEAIKKYKYLKNGAMYSILFLGIIMLLDAFGYGIPQWISPIMTFVIVGYFFWLSKKALA